MKNLVMGIMTKLSWSKIELFFLSRKRYCLNSECVLFVKDISDVVRKLLESFDVIVIDIDDCFDIMGHINECRWLLYEKYLRENKEKYNQVFISDIRDVLFTGDIFSAISEESYICLAKEAGKFVGGGFYDELIKEQYGIDNYNKMYGKAIFCAGTILGSINEIYLLSKIMTDVMFGGKFPNFQRSDQSAYNYVIYDDLLPNTKILYSSIEDGCIATVGLASAETINTLEKCCFSETKIIHQYDRWSNLIIKYRREYSNVDYRIAPFSFGLRNQIDYSYVTARNGDTSNTLKTMCNAVCMLIDAEQTVKYVKWSYIYWDDILAIYRAYIESNGSSVKRSGLLMKASCMEILNKLPVGNLSDEGMMILDSLIVEVEGLDGDKNDFVSMIKRVKNAIKQRRDS